MQLQELLDQKYTNIISPTTVDIGRTNLIEMDIPTEGPLIASKPYMVPLKYHEFVDHKIKQLEKACIISRSTSDWARIILVVPKKKENAQTGSNTSGSKIVSLICDCASTTGNSIVRYKQLTRLKPMEV